MRLLVSSALSQISKIANSRGMTGADAAFRLLQLNGITDVRIKVISGTLTDYYDPKNKEICLSQDVFSSRSIAAIGVACHEAGHACQHAQGYAPLKIRNAVIPATRIGTWLGVPLCLIGVAINSEAMAYIGLAFYFTDDEYSGAKKVLTAAALTYVAALASALATIFRLLLIIAGGNRRR